LNPLVADLAHQVMLRINQSAAVNSVNLLATCLLSAPQQVMPEQQLLTQMSLYRRLLQQVPYHPNVSFADGEVSDWLRHAQRLQKVQIDQDNFGALVRFAPHDQVLMSYYRSNISHLFMIPAILATALLRQQSTATQLLQLCQQLQPLLEQELFLQPQHLQNYVEGILLFLQQEKLIFVEQAGAEYHLSLQSCAQLELLATLADGMLQRHAMVLQLIADSEPMERDELEQKAHQLALRLLTLHGLDAPEFHDKKLFVTLINALKDQGYLHVDAEHKLRPAARFSALEAAVYQLLPATVSASIRQIGASAAS
jgi:glycerol-3-phosphate O-acyltransferase